jgi:hypothetical protein
MKIILLAVCFLFLEIGHAQQTHKTTYIPVVFEQARSKLSKKNFFKIIEQSGNQLAWEIVSLVPYDDWNQTIYTDMMYNGYLDSTRKYYNYFERPVEAFQFLADNNWELVNSLQR